MRDQKTLNLSSNIVSLQVLGWCFAFTPCPNLLLKADPRSTFRNSFLQPATIFSLCDKLITQDQKREISTQNLQWLNVARQVKRFRISNFAASVWERIVFV